MWSIVSGCGVPLKNPMIIASFVSAMASSDRNISCRSKFSIQNCALFSGSPTARLKCQTAPSCTFTSIPLRNASSRGLYARMMRAFCAFVMPRLVGGGQQPKGDQPKDRIVDRIRGVCRDTGRLRARSPFTLVYRASLRSDCRRCSHCARVYDHLFFVQGKSVYLSHHRIGGRAKK